MSSLPHVFLGTLALAVAFTVSARSADWGDCRDALNQLQSSAINASTEADETADAAEEFADCTEYPSLYDLLEDNCESKRSNLQSERDDVESAVSQVRAYCQSVEADCDLDAGYSVGIRYCLALMRFAGAIPGAQLLGACRAVLGAPDCDRCLGFLSKQPGSPPARKPAASPPSPSSNAPGPGDTCGRFGNAGRRATADDLLECRKQMSLDDCFRCLSLKQ